MPGPADDDTTSKNPLWFLNSELAWLASRELAFVSKWIGEAAPRYLRELLTSFEFMKGWYAEIEIEETGDLRARSLAGLLTSSRAAHRALWNDRDYPSVEWKPSRAVYVGPVMRLHKNPDGSESVVRDHRASVRITAELIRFRHSFVVCNLCSRGLMQQPGLVVEPAIVEAPVFATIPTESEVETKPAKLSRKGWLERRYPPGEAATNDLARRFDTITKASEAIYKEMGEDPNVEAYGGPRQIEPYLADLKLWPKIKRRS